MTAMLRPATRAARSSGSALHATLLPTQVRHNTVPLASRTASSSRCIGYSSTQYFDGDSRCVRPNSRVAPGTGRLHSTGELPWARGMASRAGNDVMSGQWSIKSPRQLYDHLSQYIIGQERAKRILSVAVFNHYLRITPPNHPNPETSPPPPPPASSTPDRQPSSYSGYASPSSSPDPLASASGLAPSAPPPFPSTPSLQPAGRSYKGYATRDREPLSLDPSRAGAELEDGTRRDLTRAVGANGEGADPTLTHDLLDARSREGIWARDGFFSSSRPNERERPRRRRAVQVPPPSADGRARPVARLEDVEEESRAETARRKAELEEGFLATSSTRPGRSRGSEGEHTARRSLEDVVVEKSNVLMIGPTGTGKTLMAKTLAKVLDVPFASCDATTYTQAGYVGDDVENCVLRLLQNADFDVSRAEVGIIHIDEVDKLARRGGGEYGSWGGGRDVGGEGVQQSLLRLLEGTNLTLQAKPPANWSPTAPSGSAPASGPWAPGAASSGTSTKDGSASSARTVHTEGAAPAGTGGTSASASGGPSEWDPNNPMNRGFGASGKKGVREGLPGFSGGGGGGAGGKTETFVVDTSNILFVLSGAFVGLESIVQRRLGRGSIGFGAPLPKHTSQPDTPESSLPPNTVPLKGLTTADLVSYGLIPEFLGRLPVLSTLHPLSVEDLVRILDEPKNALIKQYQAQFEKIGAELQFTDGAIQEIARIGLKRGGGARGLRGILEEVLLDAMYDAPGSSIRYVLISETVVKGSEAVHYFSRGQRVQFVNMLREENDRLAARFTSGGGGGGRSGTSDDGQSGVTGEEEEEGGVGLRAYG